MKYFNQRLLNFTQRFCFSDYIFFAQYVMQQLNLFNQINIAASKVKGGVIKVGNLLNNYNETLRRLICEDKGYSL